ncbi:MAG: peptide chain release factor N(5)-glutamine methyltransferase [Clostridiales bacterium]|nr:peptide chain release factor N(5)-glutamine methyltransferase [Clostridiales bacterium]
MTVREAIFEASKQLAHVGNPVLDAQLLLAHVLNVPKISILTDPARLLHEDEQTSFRHLVSKREERIPIQYILEQCEFMSLKFDITPDVLIPRGDTETLVEATLKCLKGHDTARALDIGTGSGCIAVSLAHYAPQIEVDAMDISAAALKLARQNAAKHAVDGRVTFMERDIFSDCSDLPKYHAIVSNPPYIKSDVIPTLQPEVSKFEPRAALDGGADGLKFYRRLAEIAPFLVRKEGYVILEIGENQLADIVKIFAGHPLLSINDLSGTPRTVIVHY